MKKEVFQIALTLLPKVGPVTARNLVSYCGSPEGVFEARKKDLVRIPRIGPILSETIQGGAVLAEAEKELQKLEEQGIQFAFYLDEKYPSRLKPFDDSPVCLFYKGEIELNPARTLGIVGTRNPTIYGIQQCENLVRDLSGSGVTICSGLAFGIDSVAHRSAVQAGVPTWGILANGLGSIYPKAHTRLAHRMLDKGGLMSEHPADMRPEKEFFPMRNRIIAALSDALVVVESGKTGGSLITAEFANRYGREVFAVPGRVQDDRSAGCHLLIKNHKAYLMESAEDILKQLGWDDESGPKSRQPDLLGPIEEQGKKIINLLRESGPKGVDEIAWASALSISETVSQLLDLECNGWVRTLPGNQYMVVR